MNSWYRLERAVHCPVTPNSRANSKDTVHMPARATGQISIKKNIFDRVLAHVTGWIKFRVAAARLENSLAPFVQFATKKYASAPTVDQCEALNAILNSALSDKNGEERLVYDVVSQTLAKMTGADKVAFRSVLVESNKMLGNAIISEDAWNALLVPVTESLAKTIASNADSYALLALQNVAGTIEQKYSIENLLIYTAGFLKLHLEVITPIDDSGVDGFAPLAPAAQMASIAMSKESAVLKWFDAQSKPLQTKILKKLKSIARDRTLKEKTATIGEQRLRAFGIRMLEVLPKATSS